MVASDSVRRAASTAALSARASSASLLQSARLSSTSWNAVRTVERVGGARLGELVACLAQLRHQPAPLEQRQGDVRPQGPPAVGGLQQVDPACALEAGGGAEGDLRVEGGPGDADPGVGRRGPPLRRRDVGAPPQQHGGGGHRRARRGRQDGVRRQREARGRLADQDGDLVLQQRSRGRDIDQLGAGGLQLGLGAADVEAGDRAATMQVFGQGERLGEGVGGIGQHLALGVEAAQGEIGVSQLRLQAESHGCDVGAAGLGLGATLGDQVAHPAPQIELVGGAGPHGVVVIVAWAAEPKGAVGGLLVVGGATGGGDLREKSRAGLRGKGARLVVARQREGEVGVGCLDHLLQIVQRPVAVHGPPIAARCGVVRAGRGPRAGLLVGGRGGRRQRQRRVGRRQGTAGERSDERHDRPLGHRPGEPAFRVSHGSYALPGRVPVPCGRAERCRRAAGCRGDCRLRDRPR